MPAAILADGKFNDELTYYELARISPYKPKKFSALALSDFHLSGLIGDNLSLEQNLVPLSARKRREGPRKFAARESCRASRRPHRLRIRFLSRLFLLII